MKERNLRETVEAFHIKSANPTPSVEKFSRRKFRTGGAGPSGKYRSHQAHTRPGNSDEENKCNKFIIVLTHLKINSYSLTEKYKLKYVNDGEILKE